MFGIQSICYLLNTCACYISGYKTEASEGDSSKEERQKNGVCFICVIFQFIYLIHFVDFLFCCYFSSVKVVKLFAYV